jgi:acyl-CoA synthetase (NDP forming)
VAFTREEAVRQASAIGFPIVMKIRSSTIVHKTDVDGVVLDIKNQKEAAEAFDSLQAGINAAGLAPRMQGVMLQPMVYGGQEVIMGMVQDPVFGPLIMVGLGGIQVELMKDVSFWLHPLTELDPARMLKQLKSLPLLTGWRGRPRRDVEALKNVLLRFSVLIEDLPEIEQAEINPLIVFNEGWGCAALDARIFIKKQG